MDYFIFGEFMSCFIDFIDINLLEKYTLTNLVSLRDLVTGWVKKDGTVEKVTIGEIYPFKKNSVFEYDTKIVIEYHTFKKK